MKHLTDGMLLAYVRQQQRDLWPDDIQEHIANCPVCRRRCAEFKAIGNTIEAWTRSSAIDPLYETVSNRVMRTLYEPQAAPIKHMRNGMSRVRVGLPLAVVLVLLCAVLLVGLGENIVGNVARSNRAQPTPKVVSQQPAVTQSEPTATSTPVRPVITFVPVVPVTTVTAEPSNGSPTATSTSHSEPSIQVNAPCTTSIDVIESQLLVCGTHFTPGTTVAIDYRIGTKHKKHTMQVESDGTFIDVLYIYDCNDVPGSIYVRSSTNPAETAQVTKNISFGTC